MLALTERQRRFVLAMASDPLASHQSWAIAAGYKDCGNGGIRVRAHEAYHNLKVQAAVQEVARATLGVQGPLVAVHAVLNMARNSEHPQHSRAVEMILNRTGMAEKQQIEVVHRDLTGDALMERVRALAEKHGVNLGAALGVDGPKQIEGRALEVVSHETQDGGENRAQGCEQERGRVQS